MKYCVLLCASLMLSCNFAKQKVTGKKGETGYVDFVFDKRTNIERKGKLLFE